LRTVRAVDRREANVLRRRVQAAGVSRAKNTCRPGCGSKPLEIWCRLMKALDAAFGCTPSFRRRIPNLYYGYALLARLPTDGTVATLDDFRDGTGRGTCIWLSARRLEDGGARVEAYCQAAGLAAHPAARAGLAAGSVPPGGRARVRGRSRGGTAPGAARGVVMDRSVHASVLARTRAHPRCCVFLGSSGGRRPR